MRGSVFHGEERGGRIFIHYCQFVQVVLGGEELRKLRHGGDFLKQCGRGAGNNKTIPDYMPVPLFATGVHPCELRRWGIIAVLRASGSKTGNDRRIAALEWVTN